MTAANLPPLPPTWMLAGGLVAGALLWVNLKGARDSGRAVGGALVDAVDGVLSGVVETVGQGVGIPRTDLTECERAKLEGRTWDASFACPAGDFLRYVWS